MNLLAVLMTGLLAGGASCAAVQGGLLAGLIARQQAAHSEADWGAAVSGPNSVARDIEPVGGFLVGKLLSHALLGALLGGLGGMVELSVHARTALQIGAGLLVVTFGLAQLGVPGFRRIVITVPQSWGRFVRGQARSQAVIAPALLGMATVALPCGVTVAMETLALASGSPWRGAAIMAVFVVGTSPLFAILGFAARRVAGLWRGRLVVATGAVILAMGLYTLNGGLELANSPVAASHLVRSFSAVAPAGDTSTTITSDGHQQIVITASDNGYSPRVSRISAGHPTTLVVHSVGATGCVRTFVVNGTQTVLPENGDTRIDLGTPSVGDLRYSCGMGMYTGIINAT